MLTVIILNNLYNQEHHHLNSFCSSLKKYHKNYKNKKKIFLTNGLRHIRLQQKTSKLNILKCLFNFLILLERRCNMFMFFLTLTNIIANENSFLVENMSFPFIFYRHYFFIKGPFPRFHCEGTSLRSVSDTIVKFYQYFITQI